MQPHIIQRADEIRQEHRTAMDTRKQRDKIHAERAASVSILRDVLDAYDQGFGLDTEMIATIRAFLQDVEGK